MQTLTPRLSEIREEQREALSDVLVDFSDVSKVFNEAVEKSREEFKKFQEEKKKAEKDDERRAKSREEAIKRENELLQLQQGDCSHPGLCRDFLISIVGFLGFVLSPGLHRGPC